jgi:hypothetical protein
LLALLLERPHDGDEALLSAVNAFLAQPFINYNMALGWYLTSTTNQPQPGWC